MTRVVEPFIKLSGVSLSLPTFLDIHEGWWSKLQLPRRVFTRVLEDISFEITSGERVALIGRNGAGKSTLLNVLSGVYPPSLGTTAVRGDVKSLLNVGLGFNYEATLRENIVLRCAAMGETVAFARSIIDDVLEFAELAQVADRRLSTLSAGQRMRLGFAISTQVQPQVLLLDEWIGTGDESFIKKAKSRMRDRVNNSGIVVLASHNQALLRDVCTRAIVLELGKVVFDGPVDAALRSYRELVGIQAPAVPAEEFVGKDTLAMGEFFGLKGVQLQKLFENLSFHSYGATFLTPVNFSEVSNRISAAIMSKGFNLERFEGAARIEGVWWSGEGRQVRLSLKGCRGAVRRGEAIQVFTCHLKMESLDA